MRFEVESRLQDLHEAFERWYVQPKPGRTLIVGSRVYEGREDRRQRYPNTVGVDMLEGDGVDLVVNLEEPVPEGLGQFAHIECDSVLEHSRRPWLLAANLERLMEEGATLFLSVPFVWRVHFYPQDLFRFTAEGVRTLFPGVDWTRLAYASDKLRPDTYIKAQTIEGHPYFPRTEVLGFGVKR